MGKRTRKRWDLPSEYGLALAVLSAAFLAGGVIGCLFVRFAGQEGAQELSGYLADYLRLCGEGMAARSFWPSLWGQLRWLLLALLLGLTAAGLLGLPALFLARGFFLSFSAACFYRVFGGAGLLPTFALFGLPALLWAPALFLAGAQGLAQGAGMCQRGGGDGLSPFQNPAFWVRAAVCLGLIFLCGMLEYAAAPVLVRAVSPFVLGGGAP